MAMSAKRLKEIDNYIDWISIHVGPQATDMLKELITEVQRLQVIEIRVTKGTQATKMRRQRTRGENSHGG